MVAMVEVDINTQNSMGMTGSGCTDNGKVKKHHFIFQLFNYSNYQTYNTY